ncbi:ankyrin repeat domain-containing protein [Kistimonas asteriae]|uniref:ankyrin repeat domain-containing protein n=1 Tax=Kistimonas asteriae TaxID=517724 RepID=UPI001BAB7E88|nr:ankyrin repeat domain-containing protein [Kistimonas asteriae]
MLFDNGIKSLEWNVENKVWQLADDIRVNIDDSKGGAEVTLLAIYFTLTVTDVMNTRGRHIEELGSYRVCAQALQKASRCGCLPVVRKLVEAGVSPDLVNDSGELTALQLAVVWNQISEAEYLIRHGADVNRLEPGLEGITSVQRAAINGNADIIKLLIRSGADYEAPNVVGESPLCHAIRSHDLDSVDVLLNYNAACNFVTSRQVSEFHPFSVDHGAAPIHIAVHEGICPIIKRLLQHGVNINIKTKGWRYTALKKAFWGETHGDPVKVMALLLSYRAQIDSPDIFSHSEKPRIDAQQSRSVLVVLAMLLYQGNVGRALVNALDGRMFSILAQGDRLNVNSLHALVAQRIWESLWHSMGLRMMEWLYVNDYDEIRRHLGLPDKKIDFLRFGSLGTR